MTDWMVSSSLIKGSLTLPPSKSQTMRALLFALLAKGQSTIRGALQSPDTDCLYKIMRQMGAQIDGDRVHSIGIQRVNEPLYVGNSGILFRFLTAICAGSGAKIIGDHSISTQRPIKPLLDALEILNKHGSTSVNGSDSQFVSALLIAACLRSGPTEINVTSPGELPWIDLTLDWLDRMEVQHSRRGYDQFIVQPKAISPFEYSVPGDVSSAAYPAAAALLSNSSVEMRGFQPSDPQGDIHLFEIFEEMGAKVDREEGKLTVTSVCKLRGVDVDLSSCIDAITLLPVLATQALSPTRIRGCKIARTKECDRISAITAELRKMGANIEELEDGMIVHPSELSGATVASHGDHRMALSLATAAFCSKGSSLIEGTDCANKTYPRFIEEMNLLGATIEAK